MSYILNRKIAKYTPPSTFDSYRKKLCLITHHFVNYRPHYYYGAIKPVYMHKKALKSNDIMGDMCKLFIPFCLTDLPDM